MEVYINNLESLTKLGLSLEDINDLKLLINTLNEKGLIKINESNIKNFDFQDFFLCILEDKQILKEVLIFYNKLINNQPEILLERMDINPGLYNFKWNLSLLILLNKHNYLNNYYELEPFLEMDKNQNKIYNDLFSSFFEMIRLGFKSLADIYDLFNKAIHLERSGWKDKKLPLAHKESIAEHMYLMQILAKMYLPKELDNDLKQDVIDMVLLHDLGETLTGDIPYPNKQINDDINEDLKVKACGIALIYYSSSWGRRFLTLWNEWFMNISEASHLAHDLDVVQLNNQLLNYALEYPDYFTIDELKEWFKRRPIYQTGLDMFDLIIENNEKKKALVKQILNK